MANTVLQSQIKIQTSGKGFYLITNKVQNSIKEPINGLINCFIQHTSASLCIQENADPTARMDLQRFLEELAPEHQIWHQHTLEGPDDTTSHLKSMLTQTSLVLPVQDGKLALGTWQGIYLIEHREIDHQRKIFLTILS